MKILISQGNVAFFEMTDSSKIVLKSFRGITFYRRNRGIYPSGQRDYEQYSETNKHQIKNVIKEQSVRQ
jgi:hypothetical protein